MHEALKLILEMQEKDVKMIRLMRLKRDRQKELENLSAIQEDFKRQLAYKDSEILELRKQIRLGELEVSEAGEKVQKLEKQQNSVKKVDEFNALSKEIAAAEREKAAKEQRLSDLMDKLAVEDDVMARLQETIDSTKESSTAFEAEIKESIRAINQEGRDLRQERDDMIADCDPEVLAVYDKLLKNKKDRVVVPIENRTCSGCHIVLTAQHENLVRKGERLVFCEHCSRILYWDEGEPADSSAAASSTKRRRRRVSA